MAAFLSYRVYKTKKYLHPDYATEFGKSTIADAVHGNTEFLALKKKLELALRQQVEAMKM